MKLKTSFIAISALVLSALTACAKAPTLVELTTAADSSIETSKTESVAAETSETIATTEALETAEAIKTTEAIETTEKSETSESPIIIDIGGGGDTETEATATEKEPDSEETTSAKEDTQTTEAPTEKQTEATSALEPTEAKTPDEAYNVVNAQYAANQASTQALYQTIKESKTLPCINFTTQDNAPVVTKQYQYAVVDIFNCDSQYELSTNGQVKVRGNSSAEGDEKPYRIKFDSKHSMLGLHDNRAYKSWVLLRTYWNVVPDYTAFKLADTIFQGEYFTSDGTFVNVYVNGEYKGLYLLCEQNSTGKDRFDVKEPKGTEAGSEIGYVIEMDNYDDREHPVFAIYSSELLLTDINGETRNIESNRYSIKSDITTEEQKEFITKYIRGVFTILYEASMNDNPMMFDADYNVVSAAGKYSAYEAVDAVIDTKSLANMLILEELVHDYDVGEGSFYMAVDFSEKSGYRKLTFCGPWDFSWCYEGDTSGNYYASTWQKMMSWGDNSNTWFIMAMRLPEFQQLVKQRWATVSDKLVATTQKIDTYVDTLVADASYISGGIICAHRIQDYIRGRIDWFNSIWK